MHTNMPSLWDTVAFHHYYLRICEHICGISNNHKLKSNKTAQGKTQANDPFCNDSQCTDPLAVWSASQWACMLAASLPTHLPVNNLFNLMSAKAYWQAAECIFFQGAHSCVSQIKCFWKIQSFFRRCPQSSYKLLKLCNPNNGIGQSYPKGANIVDLGTVSMRCFLIFSKVTAALTGLYEFFRNAGERWPFRV